MSRRTLPVLRVGATFACLFTAGTLVPAAQLPRDGSVPLLRLDVVVTDDLGGAIRGLRAADFAIREDGTARPVETAEFRWIPSDYFGSGTPILTRADEEREARQPGARVFAFLLDEFHVRPGVDSHAVRDAVASFIDDKMFARDLAVVARPLDAMDALRFTRDQATLMGNVAAFSGRKGQYTPRTPREAALVGSDPDVVPAARERVLKAGLRDLAERLAQLRADRAVIVLVSEGFSASLPIDDREPDLARLVAASSRFHVPIYVLNPSGPAVAGERAEDAATLQRLADMTGGLLFRAEHSIAGFAKVFHDTHGYYALTYRPAHADGGLHQIEIVTRANKRPRGASIYWAANGEGQEHSAVTEWPSTRELRRSPLIDAWTGLRADGAGPAQMMVTWEPRPGQSAHAQRVVVSAKTAMGATLFEGAIAAIGTAPSADRATLKVPSGQVELDLAILDANGRLLDRDARNLDVPDLGPSGQPGPVLLPVEIMCLPAGRASEASAWSDPLASYLARGCSRGSRVIVRVPTADPTGTAVLITARLLNRAGQTMRALDAESTGERTTRFTLPLASFPPGQYEIEVTGQNRYGVVSDRVTFRVES